MRCSPRCNLMYANDRNDSRHLAQHGQIPQNISEFTQLRESPLLGLNSRAFINTHII